MSKLTTLIAVLLFFCATAIRADSFPNVSATFENVRLGSSYDTRFIYRQPNLNLRISSPAWSPDGTQIAFVVGFDEAEWDIFVMDANGANVRRLTTELDASPNAPSWTPDGSGIIFSYGSEIYQIQSDGSNFTALTQDFVPNSSPDMSPDGLLAFSSPSADGNWDIYVKDPDNSVRRLTNDSADDLDLAWSPDGTKIAYLSRGQGPCSFCDGPDEIRVMNADGSNIQSLTSDSNYPNASGPTWSPDGNQIAFAADGLEGALDIYIMDANGGNVTNITNHAYADFVPAWSPDGNQIAFSSLRTWYGIFVMDVDGNNVDRLNVEIPENPTP